MPPNLRKLYERVWDEADYVVPPAENGAFFVTTNVVITPNQTLGRCPEVKENINIFLLFTQLSDLSEAVLEFYRNITCLKIFFICQK